MGLRKKASCHTVFDYVHSESITRSLRAFVSFFDRGHIQVSAREIVEKNLGGRAALKPRKGFDITQAVFASLDHGI